MEGSIDISYITEQRDLFTSGLVAEIGVNAYAVWKAIKAHADFKTGEAYPGMRKIGQMVGLSAASVLRAIKILRESHMVRIVEASKFKRKGQTYIARERLQIKLGTRVICIVVIDYVPIYLRARINRLNQALMSKEDDPELWAEVEIIPGPGFVWNEKSKTLKASIRTTELPKIAIDEYDSHYEKLGQDLLKKLAPNAAKHLLST